MPTVRVAVHAKPGAKRAAVGGTHGDALIVAVTARAVDGAATEAILKAAAEALGMKRRQVTLASGMTSRTKVLEFDVDDADVERFSQRLAELHS